MTNISSYFLPQNSNKPSTSLHSPPVDLNDDINHDVGDKRQKKKKTKTAHKAITIEEKKSTTTFGSSSTTNEGINGEHEIVIIDDESDEEDNNKVKELLKVDTTRGEARVGNGTIVDSATPLEQGNKKSSATEFGSFSLQVADSESITNGSDNLPQDSLQHNPFSHLAYNSSNKTQQNSSFGKPQYFPSSKLSPSSIGSTKFFHQHRIKKDSRKNNRKRNSPSGEQDKIIKKQRKGN